MYSVKAGNATLFSTRNARGISASVLISISPPLWHLPSRTQDPLFVEKKAHFVMSYLCSVQDSDERAIAYGFTGLTYSLRSPAPNHNPAPPAVHAISLVKTTRLTKSCPFVKPVCH